MRFKQFLKTWAIVLMLPVFSIVVATAAVAIQDGNLVPVTSELEQSLLTQQKNNLRQTNTVTAKPANIANNPVRSASWTKIRTQDGFVPLDDQDPVSPFPGQPFDQEPDNGVNLDQGTDGIPQVPRSSVVLEQVDPDLVGWNEVVATPSGSQLGDTLRACWISLSENGSIQGVIRTPYAASADETQLMNVFILHGGSLISETTANENGEFKIEGLKPGLYTLVGHNKYAFVTTGFIALENVPGNTNHPRSIDLLATVREGFLIADLVKDFSPRVAFRNYRMYDVGEEETDPPRLYGFVGLTKHNPAAVPAGSIQSQPVKLIDGKMVGRLHQVDSLTGRPIDLRDMTVILTQGPNIVATTKIDKFGVFEFYGLSAGTYGVVAAGSDGFGSMGVELEDGGTASSSLDFKTDANNRGRTVARFVSTASPVSPAAANGGSFDMTLASPESIGWINDFVTQQAYVEASNSPLPSDPNNFNPNFNGFDPSMYGNNGGLFGNGGGFGGAVFESAGSLAFPVGLGAIISNAIDDHDGGNVIIASPSR